MNRSSPAFDGDRIESSEAIYRQLVDHSLDCIWIISAGRFVFANPPMARLFAAGRPDAIVHHGRLDPGVILLSKPYRRSDLATMVRQALRHQMPSV